MKIDEAIAKTKAGNREAFGDVVSMYSDMAFTVALKITGKADLAEEIAQQAFIKAFVKIKQFSNGSAFSTWLYRIVYNTALTFVKKESRFVDEKPEYTLIEEEEGESFSITEEAMPFLHDALQRLREKEYLIVTFFYLEEKTISEISRITGLKDNNVKIILFRARKKLKQYIEQKMREPKLKN